MPIKLIASDMDGTLLAPDHRLSERTLQAIAAARAAGIEVLPVTGRGFRSAVDILRPARLDTAVCSNGALVYDLAAETIIETRPIPGDEVRRVVAHLRRRMPSAVFGWETTVAASFEDGFHSDQPPRWVSNHEPLNEVESAIKLFLAHPQLVESDLQHAVQPLLFPGMNVSTSGAPFVEVTAAGVDKATTLARLAAARGVDRSEVMAFGDQMNDLAMLAWAGVGVAMGNARPEAKAIADRVTSSNADHGVAMAIEDLLA